MGGTDTSPFLRAESVYAEQFNSKPECTEAAPGRIELLGNHTDYNEGFVISAALDMYISVAGGRTDSGEARIYSADYNEMCVFDPCNPEQTGEWGDYIKGVVYELGKRGIHTGGFNAAVSGTLPAGAGLSSSAALETATALMIRQLYPYDLDLEETARLCRHAENEFVGMNCGILDQFSCMFCRRDSALFLDCRSEEHETIPLGREDICVVICNTMKTHDLIGSLYNARREECLGAVRFFSRQNAVALRDVTAEMFEKEADALPENERKRARHVIYENERVLKGRDALYEGDIHAFGAYMNESHESSREMFENSTPELDMLQQAAVSAEGVLGAKLSGGGFGGCIAALAETGSVGALKNRLTEVYRKQTGIIPDVYCANISDGAGVPDRITGSTGYIRDKRRR